LMELVFAMGTLRTGSVRPGSIAGGRCVKPDGVG
jgi:hypothetical protein